VADLPKILIIDDDSAVHSSYELAAENLDVELIGTESPKKGLEILKQQKIALVFLDLKMPEMSGIDVMRKIHELGIKVSVIMVTAFAMSYIEKIKDALAEGYDFDFRKKPLDIEEIKDIMRKKARP
jgi:DNA-binding NtrC family response regulator